MRAVLAEHDDAIGELAPLKPVGILLAAVNAPGYRSERRNAHRGSPIDELLVSATGVRWNEPAHRTSLRDKVFARNASHVPSADRADLLWQPRCPVQVINDLPLTKPVRLVRHPLGRVGELRKQLPPGTFHLGFGDGVNLKALDLVGNNALYLPQVALRKPGDCDLEEVRVNRHAHVATGPTGETRRNQRAIQPRRAPHAATAAREYGFRDQERYEVWRISGWRVECNTEQWGASWLADFNAAFAGLRRLRNADVASDGVTSRNITEGVLDPAQQLRRREITNRYDERITGMVMAAVMLVEIIPGHRPQVAFIADHHVAVGMGVKRGSHNLLIECERWPVF